MDIKRIFEKMEGQSTFIKTTAKPSIDLTLKAALNRKGNMLYNAGDIEGAKRIFLTTGYSDGLVRIGDFYISKGKSMEALKMYWIAPDHKKAESIILQLSAVIQHLLANEMDGTNGANE